MRRCAKRAPVRESGGCAPVCPLLRQRCGSRGFEGGRSIPSPEPDVHTLGRLTHCQVGQPALAFLPVGVALVSAVSRAHGGAAVAMPAASNEGDYVGGPKGRS